MTAPRSVVIVGRSVFGIVLNSSVMKKDVDVVTHSYNTNMTA